MKKLSRHELMQYGTAIISFLIVMTFTLLIFFWFVQQSVDKSVQNVLQKNTLQQKDHLELVLEKEYEFLESPAAYFGTTSDLFSSDNLQLLAELASSSSFHRLMLFSTDGIGHSSDGKNTDASSRDYFQKTLEGKNNKYKVHLFNDVSEVKEPGECGGLYTGEYEKEGFIGTYMLHNQALKSEHIMISCVNNLVNPGQQLALVSGLSNYTMLPVTFKAVISEKEIVNKEKLMNLLAFNKEDLKLMKQMNYLTIQNMR